jgi:hypothetical protein
MRVAVTVLCLFVFASCDSLPLTATDGGGDSNEQPQQKTNEPDQVSDDGETGAKEQGAPDAGAEAGNVKRVRIVSSGTLVGTAPEDDPSLITLDGTEIIVRIDLMTGAIDDDDQQPCYMEASVCSNPQPDRCYLAATNMVAVPPLPDDLKHEVVAIFVPDVPNGEVNIDTDENDVPTGKTPWKNHVTRVGYNDCEAIDPESPKEKDDDLWYPSRQLDFKLPLTVESDS